MYIVIDFVSFSDSIVRERERERDRDRNCERVTRMILSNLMMVLMFFNMFVACHSMGVPWAMIIKAVNNTEKQPKLKYLRPEYNRPSEDNRPHCTVWQAIV